MSRLDLFALREGDVVELHQTLQVTRVSKDYVETQDVQSLLSYGFLPQDVDGSRSSRKLTMVKRAVRKPKVGDVITGEDIRTLSWKSGTVVQSVKSEYTYMLTRTGKWACSNGAQVDLDAFGDKYQAILLHVA